MFTIITIGALALAAVVALVWISSRTVIEIHQGDLSLEERNLIQAELELGDIVETIAMAEEQGFVPADLMRQRDEKSLEVEAARAALTASESPHKVAPQSEPAESPVELGAPVRQPAYLVGLINPLDRQ